jgi:hypothetical protein
VPFDERLPEVRRRGVVRAGPTAPRIRECDRRGIEEDDGGPSTPAQVLRMADADSMNGG